MAYSKFGLSVNSRVTLSIFFDSSEYEDLTFIDCFLRLSKKYTTTIHKIVSIY